MNCNKKSKQISVWILPAIFFVLLFLSAVIYGQVGNLSIAIAGHSLPPNVRAEQRGTRIFLPVAPVARELGYVINIDNSTETVQVRRVGIEAEYIKQTGEIRENGVTITAVPANGEVFFLPDADALLLPAEVISPLLNVSIFVEKEKNTVRIESREAASATTSKSRSKFGVGVFNYNYSSTFNAGSLYQNLNLYSAGRIGNHTYRTNGSFFGGSGGGIINFYGGNFTLNRRQGDEFQVGDLTNTVGTDLSIMNTLVRGASYARPILGIRGKLNVYGGRSFSGITDNLTKNRQTPDFDTNLLGGRFNYSPYDLKLRNQRDKDLNFSAGVVGFSGNKNRGVLTDFTGRYASKRFNMEAELAAGSFNIETNVGSRNIKGFGTALAFSASYRPWNFLTLQGRYDHYSPNFSNPTRTNSYSNRETKSAGISVQPFRNLSFGASASISENKNPISFGNFFLDKTKTESLGINFAYDPNIKLLPRISVSATEIRSPLFGNLRLIYTNLSREYKNVRPFINYILTQSGNSTAHAISAGSSIDAKRFGQFQLQQTLAFNKSLISRGNQMQCQLTATPTCPADDSSKLQLVNNSGSLDWNPNRLFFNRLQINVGAGYIRDQKTSFLIRANAVVKLPFEQNLQVSYYRSSFGSEFRFSLSGPLTFWKPRRLLKESNVASDAILTQSTIEGRVYQDEDFNREYDPQIDKPLKDVRVRLNNGVEIQTDVNGLYHFERIEPGDHLIALDMEDIRANLVSANGLEQNITVTPRSIINTSFRLVKSGSLSGRVWYDANGNGKFDEGEGLADIHVITSTGKDTYTDPDGTYLLTELPPGDQNIYIDERYKPEDLTTSILSLQAAVRSGNETKDVQFIFKTRPREIKEKNFDSKSSISDTAARVQ